MESRCAVLLPSRSRPLWLQRLFRECPSLNSPTTFIGIEKKERKLYDSFLQINRRPQIVWINNPRGFPSVAREQLRVVAVSHGGFDRYALLDDDLRLTDDVLHAMIDCHRILSEQERLVVVSGLHTLHRKWLENEIDHDSIPVGPYAVVRYITFMCWCVPAAFYDQFQYPADSALDDVYCCMAALKFGLVDWYVCLHAGYESEGRWAPGGIGTVPERIAKLGDTIKRFALDFPEWVTPGMVRTNFPYGDWRADALAAVRQRRLFQERAEKRRTK